MSALELAPAGHRFGDLVVAGSNLSADVTAAVVGSPVLELSVDATSELSLELADPELALLRSGLFAERVKASAFGLDLEVAALEVTGDTGAAHLVVDLRSAGVEVLKRRKGALLRRNTSPSAWVEAEAATVGLSARVQPSAKRATIARTSPSKGAPDADPESSWDVFTRLADELGGDGDPWLVFEFGGEVTFASRKWLAANPPRRWTLVYPGRSTVPAGALGVLGVPQVRRSQDADEAGTLEVDVPRTHGLGVRPGDVVALQTSFPVFGGVAHLVESVTIPAADEGVVHLSAVAP